jgi:glycosyltransferase involved in cell wall biosynthesis
MRMPTDRAHGVQAMRTCAALAGAGAQVTFYHPWRRQSPGLRGADPFAYYGLERTFALRRLPHLDPHLLEPLPHRLLAPAFIAGNVLFGLTAAMAIRRARPDVAYTRHLLAAWWLVRMGVPTVFEAHRAGTDDASGRVVRLLARLSLHLNLRLVVSISHALRDRLQEAGVPASKLTVASDAVDVQAYASPLTQAQARASLGLPVEGALVVYTGQLISNRGADVLARAAALMPQVSVLLVGGTEADRARVRASAAGAPNVRFVEQVPPDRVPVYQWAADVLSLPQTDPRGESPMKLFEYLAAGRPMVASDLPPLREVLTHERNALLVAPGDAGALAGAVHRLLGDAALGERLAAQGREDVAGLTWAARAQGLLAAVRGAL